MIIKLKDVNIIEQAAKLIRDKFKIGLNITQCSMRANSWTATADIPTYSKIDTCPVLTVELAVTKDHDGWTEYIDMSYAIYGRDLEDNSLVDELIGGDLKKQAPDMRQTLRLAFILYDGIRYATTGEHKKAYTDKGWRSRVLNIQRLSYVAKS